MTHQFDFSFDDAYEPAPPTLPKSAAQPTAKPVAKEPASASPADKPASLSDHDLETSAAKLEAHPDYRVLRRLQPVLHFDRAPLGATKRVVLLDTETTGLDQSKEKIIELAMVVVDVCTVTGLPCGPVTVFDEFDDPGKPITPEIEQLTGISNEMVKGQRLNEARIAELLDGVDLVVAHNAAFDRPFVEARVSGFETLPWACSVADMDWKAAGQSSAKLEILALRLGWFYDAHRAEADCHALLKVLCSEPVAGQGTGLARLIAAASQTAYRLQATNAPFETKDLLKARGYRWNNEQRVWGTRLSGEDALQTELAWLQANVYKGRNARVLLETLKADTLYSSRSGEVESRMVEG